MFHTSFRYDRPLKKSEVLVCLLDSHREYSTLSERISSAARDFEFTFIEGWAALAGIDTKQFQVRHLIVCDGENDPAQTTAKYQEQIAVATSVTLAIRYSSVEAFERAAATVEALKLRHAHKINYLRPTEVDGRFVPSLQKLVDNSICDSVRIKYRPRQLGALLPGEIPPAVRDFFSAMSHLVEEEELYHRAPTDGFISLRDPDGAGFFITCTKTSKIGLDLSRIARVDRYERETNQLYYSGAFLPSSDSVEAAILYASLPGLTAMLHTHASARFTRNPNFQHKIAVPPASYGEADLGDRVAAYVKAQAAWDFVIMEDHGELFFSRESTTAGHLAEIGRHVRGPAVRVAA